MSIKVPSDNTKYNVNVTPQLKQTLVEIIRHNNDTAAHRTLKFGTMVKVTNTDNGKSVVVRINDRGPFTKSKLIDLSPAAFEELASLSKGVINVKIEVVKEKDTSK